MEGLGIIPDRGRAWEFIIVVVLLGFCMSIVSSWLQQRFQGKLWLLITGLSSFAILFVATVFFFYLTPRSFVVRIPIVVPLQREANGDYAALHISVHGETFFLAAGQYFNEWYRRTIRAHSKRWVALGKGIKKRDQWLRSVVDILQRHFLWHSRNQAFSS